MTPAQFEAAIHIDRDKADKDGMLLRHKDPRPDLADDHDHWKAVLTEAYAYSRELWGVLHGLRCAGARLRVIGGKFGMKLEYAPALKSIAMTEAELRETWLVPNTQGIKEVFARVSAS